MAEDFDVWSGRKLEQKKFEAWSDKKKAAAQGDLSSVGKMYGLHPGVAEVDRQAKAAQNQAAVTPAQKPDTQVKAPPIPVGQSVKLGETNAPKLKPKSQLRAAPGSTALDKTEGLALSDKYSKAKSAEQTAKNEAYRAIRTSSEDLTASHKWDAALQAKEEGKRASNNWWQGAGERALSTFAKAPMEAASRGVRLRDDPYQPGTASLPGAAAKLGELPPQTENKYRYMSGAERQIYNYWQDRDPVAARDYLTMLEPQLDRRNAGELAANLREEARTNPAAGFAQNIAGSYFSPLSLAASAVQNIKNAVTGEAMPVNANSTAMIGAVMAQASETGLLDQVDSKAGKQILSTALSIAQVASRLPMGAAGLPFMAASAGGQTAQQAAAQGRSAADVLALGLQTAVTEYLTEKLPFDEMLRAAKTGGSIVKSILKTAAAEGLEEWANDYLNTLGNNFILGSESEMRQAVQALTAQGMSPTEAQKQVTKEYLVWRPLQSALGGILTGGAVGGGSAAYGNYSMSKGPLPEDVNATQISAGTEIDTPENAEGIANLKKLPLVNQNGSVYTGEKGTDFLNNAARWQGLPADGTLQALLTSPLGRTALEKVTGQSGTVPFMVSGYRPQTRQSPGGPVPAAGTLSSRDMAIIMLNKLADSTAPIAKSDGAQLSPHRIYKAYLDVANKNSLGKQTLESILNNPIEGAGDLPIKPYTTSRPKYGRTQVDDVWNAHANPETGTVADPSGATIVWDRTKPRNGQWDMGHIPGQKYSDIHARYMNGELSLDKFLKWYRNSQNYRPELPRTNRSHLYEDNWPYLK